MAPFPGAGRVARTIPITASTRRSGFGLMLLGRLLLASVMLTVLAGSAVGSLPTEKALQSRDPELRTQFRQAVETFAAGEYASAETLFVQLSRCHGIPEHDSQIFLFMWGRCLYAQGDYAACCSHYAAYLDQFPNSENAGAAWVLIGHSRYFSGDILGAARAYLMGMTRGPEPHRQIALNNLEPLVRRGLPLSVLGSLANALGDDRWSAQARFWIAERWDQAHRRPEAMREFRCVARDAGRTDLGKAAQNRIRGLEQAGPVPAIIGLLLPLTGEYADYGRRARAAAELAIDSASGSARLVIVDARDDPLQAALGTDSLIQTGCVAVIGPLLPDCIAASAGALRALDVVQILPVVRRGAAELATFSPWIIGLSVPPERQARQLLLAAVQTVGLRRFAALVAETPESRAAAEAFAAAGSAVGATVHATAGFAPGESDYRASIRQLARAVLQEAGTTGAADTSLASDGGGRPLPIDGLLIWGADPEDLARIVPLVREAGFRCYLLGDQNWEEYATLPPIRPVLDSIIFVSDQVMDTANPVWQGFARRYRESYGADPDWLAARVYDAIGWVVAGVKRGASDGTIERLLDGGSSGVSGTYEFESGRVVARARVFRRVDGRLQPLVIDSSTSLPPRSGPR